MTVLFSASLALAIVVAPAVQASDPPVPGQEPAPLRDAPVSIPLHSAENHARGAAPAPNEANRAGRLLKLAPPAADRARPLRKREGVGGGLITPPGAGSLATIGGSLAIVTGLFLIVTWCLRRGTTGGSRALPTDVVELLGHRALPKGEQMHLIRVGTKLLLVCVAHNRVETLTEIADRDEADRLAGLCRQGHPQSATAAFRNVMEQMGRDREGDRFFGADHIRGSEPRHGPSDRRLDLLAEGRHA